ncbi:MAG: hypothetical protein ACJAWZ_004174 [Paracoccaceae bacterium]|jgi:hypothetical protein
MLYRAALALALAVLLLIALSLATIAGLGDVRPPTGPATR